MKAAHAIPLLVLALLGLAGCAHAPKGPTYESAARNPFIPTNQQAADVLMLQLEDSLPAGSGPLLVATLVNIDALEQSSTLGRLVSEQVSARFTQAGYKIVEMKFGNSVYMRQDQGEMMLTREVHELASTHAAKAVIVGSYAESKNYVFVNLKVVQPSTNAIIAVHDYALPVTDSVWSMLRGRR